MKDANSSDRGSRSEKRDLRAEFREMVKSMEFINAQFENFKKELSVVVAENKKLKDENECLRQQCTQNAQHIKDLDAKLTQCDQYS
ncbi:hypothetical protein HPB48_013206 [Haemaphysalis longicornis]|uniref:Uncharacterized protein n=1 Tax=Haemaphysalis longicornis TaxID=44386 RepID=A0A9J6GV56_HAELO|nr:hypothetical protein HPB48_013206 [Haemaphysalis longicornis]